MAQATHVQTSFTAGEVTPRLLGRSDLKQYFGACKRLENFIVRPFGIAEYRPGLRYVAATKYNNTDSILVPFQYKTEAYYMLEFGETYIRFYRDRAQLLDGGVPYEIASPYAAGDLAKIKFFQSNDVLYLLHPNYAMRELVRFGDIDWNLSLFDFVDGPYQARNDVRKHKVRPLDTTGALHTITTVDTTNGRVSVDGDHTPTGDNHINVGDMIKIQSSTLNDGVYLVTALDYNTIVVGKTTMTLEGGGANIITDATVDGSVRTPIEMKASLDTWSEADATGYRHISVAQDVEGPNPRGWAIITRFIDARNIRALVVENFANTTASFRWRLGAFGDYDSDHPVEPASHPSVGTFHQLRLWLGGTISEPQTLWGSRVDDFTSFKFSTYASGVVADDHAVTFTLDTDRVNTIRWMSSTAHGLVIGTDGSELLLPTSSDEAISATNPPMILPQTHHGSRELPNMQQIGSVTVFVQKSGRKVMAQEFKFASDQFEAANLNKLNDEITIGLVKEITWQQEQFSVLWAMMEDGTLAGMTWMSEGDDTVTAWSRLIPGGTDASIESVATVHDAPYDRLWCIVKRTINGLEARYVEYLTDKFETFHDQDDAFFVDSGAIYDGTPATVISGLDHLEGATVRVLADGAYIGEKVVSGGQITLDDAASTVIVGLGYDGRIVTMPIEPTRAQIDPRGKFKGMWALDLTVYRSLGGKIGPEGGTLDPLVFRDPYEPLTTDYPLFTGLHRVAMETGYDRQLTIEIQQTQPLPFEVLSIIYDMDLGGV